MDTTHVTEAERPHAPPAFATADVVGDIVWMIESASRPGSYWPVVLDHIGSRTRLTCSCERGRTIPDPPHPTDRGCRHMREVVKIQNAEMAERYRANHPRPSVRPSAFVD